MKYFAAEHGWSAAMAGPCLTEHVKMPNKTSLLKSCYFLNVAQNYRICSEEKEL